MAPPGSEAVFVTSISCADSAGASVSVVDGAKSLPRREARVLASLGDVSAGGRGVGSVELAASVWALEALAGVPPAAPPPPARDTPSPALSLTFFFFGFSATEPSGRRVATPPAQQSVLELGKGSSQMLPLRRPRNAGA